MKTAVLYPPPAAPCGCGHPEATHECRPDHSRGHCRTGDQAGPCHCTRYHAGGAQ